MLALLSWQTQRGFAFGAIAEHVGVGVLIATVLAEQTAHLIFKRAPFCVLGLSFVYLARHDARGGPDAKTHRRSVQNARDDCTRQCFAPDPGHGQRYCQQHDGGHRYHAAKPVAP